MLRRVAKCVFLINKFVGKSKLLEYSPKDMLSMCYKIVSKANFPGGEITQVYHVGKLAPLFSKGLQEERGLYPTSYTHGYMSEYMHCTPFVALRVSQLITVSQHQPNLNSAGIKDSGVVDLHEVLMMEETTYAAAMEKSFTYLTMGTRECVAPAYRKSYIALHCKNHKGIKCVDMVTTSCIAYFLMWLKIMHLLMDQIHERVWHLDKEEQAMFRKSKSKMSNGDAEKYTLRNKPVFSNKGQRKYLSHGTTKKGVKFYKRKLQILTQMKNSSIPMFKDAWEGWADNSGFSTEYDRETKGREEVTGISGSEEAKEEEYSAECDDGGLAGWGMQGCGAVQGAAGSKSKRR